METKVHPDRAVEIILGQAREIGRSSGREVVLLSEALGRTLAKEVISPVDHPPFDKAAMDGYAYSQLTSSRYRVLGSVAAGSWPSRPLGRGEVYKIMTGAPLPQGWKGVQRVEWTREEGRDASADEAFVVFTKAETQTNVIRRGENLPAGSVLLGPRVLAPQDIGILASAGIAEIEVVARPRVGVVSTGDEILSQGEALTASAIYDSNGPQLAAQSRTAGASATFYGVVPDDRGKLEASLARGLEENDVLLVSGGVSMGDFDLIPSTLEALGVEPIYHGLLMRPGKPSYFGRRGKTVVFGLPGNPVATFVGFEVLVFPYLRVWAGLEPRTVFLPALLSEGIHRSELDRVEFLPVKLSLGLRRLEARPLLYHGSSMINVLAEADALVRLEIGQEGIEAGGIVDARRIRA